MICAMNRNEKPRAVRTASLIVDILISDFFLVIFVIIKIKHRLQHQRDARKALLSVDDRALMAAGDFEADCTEEMFFSRLYDTDDVVKQLSAVHILPVIISLIYRDNEHSLRCPEIFFYSIVVCLHYSLSF